MCHVGTSPERLRKNVDGLAWDVPTKPGTATWSQPRTPALAGPFGAPPNVPEVSTFGRVVALHGLTRNVLFFFFFFLFFLFLFLLFAFLERQLFNISSSVEIYLGIA